jgi:hypothetical protein
MAFDMMLMFVLNFNIYYLCSLRFSRRNICKTVHNMKIFTTVNIYTNPNSQYPINKRMDRLNNCTLKNPRWFFDMTFFTQIQCDQLIHISSCETHTIYVKITILGVNILFLSNHLNSVCFEVLYPAFDTFHNKYL